MSIAMEILEGLWNTHLHYKGMRVNFFGVPMPWKNKVDCPRYSFKSTASRLKAKGFIEIESGKWCLTKVGKEYYENQKKLGIKFASPFALNAPKNLLLMFDIPEIKRQERHWLRWHLREFQYYMIQQSVWVGPSPLPKKFDAYLRSIDLNKYIKIFRLSKPYRIER